MKLCDFKDHKVPIEKNTWICGAIFIVKELFFLKKSPYYRGKKKGLQHMASLVDSASIWCCMYIHMGGFNCSKERRLPSNTRGKAST